MTRRKLTLSPRGVYLGPIKHGHRSVRSRDQFNAVVSFRRAVPLDEVEVTVAKFFTELDLIDPLPDGAPHFYGVRYLKLLAAGPALAFLPQIPL